MRSWQAAYGVQPDPSVAYAEAVKAIEAALIPLVLPSDHQATLGKALGTLRSTADNWELAISNNHGAPADIAPFLDLMGLYGVVIEIDTQALPQRRRPMLVQPKWQSTRQL